MPRHCPSAADQGIVRDERGEEQPQDKKRAQQVSREDKGNDPPGEKAQARIAAEAASAAYRSLRRKVESTAYFMLRPCLPCPPHARRSSARHPAWPLQRLRLIPRCAQRRNFDKG
jgi:hypothetical protein